MIVEVVRPLYHSGGDRTQTGNHPPINSEGMLLLIALDAGCFILDVRQTARLIRSYK
jgi:hypothetical protein